MKNSFALLNNFDNDKKNIINETDIMNTINTVKQYYNMYRDMCEYIYPMWFNKNTNIPNIILNYMGTHTIDDKYNNIITCDNDTDYIFKASIWHIGNMIYDNNDEKEKIKFEQLLDIYVLFSHKIEEATFIDLNKNELDIKYCLQIYKKINRNMVLDILPEKALSNNNVYESDIFNRLKHACNVNIIPLSSLGLSEYYIRTQDEKINKYIQNKYISNADMNNNWRKKNNNLIIKSL